MHCLRPGLFLTIPFLRLMPQHVSYWIRGGEEKSKEDRKVYICQFCPEELCSIQSNRDLRSGLLLPAGCLAVGSPYLFSLVHAHVVQAEWSSPSSASQNKRAIQAPPFAVEGWGSCYPAERSRAMAWSPASHSSAKSHSHWAVACLGRANLEYEFVQVPDQKICVIVVMCRAEKSCSPDGAWSFRLQVLVGCIPSEGGFPDHKMSWLVFACCFPLLINLFLTILHRFTWALKLFSAEATQQKRTSTAWELLLFTCKLASRPGSTDTLVLHIHPTSIL